MWRRIFLCLSLVSPLPGHAASLVKIPDASLRALLNAPDFAEDFGYIADILIQLRSCGVQGDVVQLRASPNEESVAPLVGLHFAVHSIDPDARCWSGPISLLDGEQMRPLLFELARGRTQLFFLLKAQGHFDLAVLDPEQEPRVASLLNRMDPNKEVMAFIGETAFRMIPRPSTGSKGILYQGLFFDQLESLALNLQAPARRTLLSLLDNRRQVPKAEWPEMRSRIERDLFPVLKKREVRARKLWNLLPRRLNSAQFEEIRKLLPIACETYLSADSRTLN
jgi:hypothetical protein